MGFINLFIQCYTTDLDIMRLIKRKITGVLELQVHIYIIFMEGVLFYFLMIDVDCFRDFFERVLQIERVNKGTEEGTRWKKLSLKIKITKILEITQCLQK